MRLLIINSVLGFGSTGRIALDIAKEYKANGHEVKIAYGRKLNDSEDAQKYGIRIGNSIDVYFHVAYTRLTDKHGLASKRATKEFLKWADEYNPDMLWLHNIHDYYINYELLFEWIKKRPQMNVRWTLHDCWSFTGHCSHFAYVKCDRWKTGCDHCPQLAQYPKSMIDNSKSNYLRKKKAFTDVKNMTLITPSNWLKNLVKESFLSEYPVEVVYNKIDTEVFKTTANSFKADHGIADKKMILGVASVWNSRKGLNDFIDLSKLLGEKYKIVLVGLTNKQIANIQSSAPSIMALPRTANVGELVKMYSAADVFVNPTYEDTFPSVNMEAEACGTPVITYDTCGCAETVKMCNSKVIKQDVNVLYDNICKHE
ncbi:glycosyltransferase [Butyrivibrio fibrisolvens]|uniref:Glycosyl transferase n=1 Tax=Butyrivibrio fibrisolvens TaxID=831 RepID=A0A317FZF4_BUTFI|nr:glycosyltransferase [Butyrivibrio fibrisolvens]PWT26241.1 glycosyl transferase [Butyrivibrio fibrisolvens]